MVCGYGSGHGAARASRWTVKAGPARRLIGANGAGKAPRCARSPASLRPRSGSMLFEGEDIAGAKRAARGGCQWHRALPGRPAGLPAHDGRGKSRHGRLSAHRCRRRSRRTAMRIYAEFPRLGRARKQAGAALLSGGEQQMLAIGRALMSRVHA